MSIQYVNTGSSANAGNGDSIRLAFTKVNNNFALVATQVADLQQGKFDNITIANTATFLDIISTGTAQLNNVSIAGTVSGTSTFQNIVVEQVATVNDLYANTIASTNTATFEDVVVNGQLFGDFTFNQLAVATTITTNHLNIGESIFVGQYQFIQTNNLSQDFAIVKDDINGLTFVLRNVHADSYAELNLQDNIQGGLSIVHQDSTNNSGNYDAGQNYIYGQTPDDTLNIGKYSNVNFYANEAQYYDPNAAGAPSINISKADGLVRFGSDVIYMGGISFQVVSDGSALVNGIPIQGGSSGNGYTGSQGDIGDLGYTGSTGLSGYTGSQGITGLSGYTGSVGFGYSGSKGDTGPQGISVTLVGSTATSAGLPLTGNPGDGWIVNNTGHLWFWNTISGAWNDIGTIVGPRGNDGPRGDQGLPGNNGNNGYTGSFGLTGYTGSIGNTGYYGSVGYAGSAGAIGYHGSAGYTGSAGVAGAVGYWGSKGYTGSAGTNGTDGYTGSAGTNGTNGTNGFTGSSGSAGFTGSAGTNGTSGYYGSAGYTGSVGSRGLGGYTGSAGSGYTGSAGVGTAGYTGSAGVGTAGYTGSAGVGTAGYTGSAGVGTAGYTGSAGTNGTNGYDGSRAQEDRLVNGDFNFILGPDGTVNFDPSSANGKGILQTAADLQFIAVDKTWTFGTDGTLTLPNGGLLYSSDTDTVSLRSPNTGQTVSVNSQTVTIGADGELWTFSNTGTMTTPGSIVPDTDIAYDLGSPDKQWRHIYVNTGSIYLGGIKLSTENNQLVVQEVTNIGGDETVVTNYALQNADRLVSGNVSAVLSNTGTLTFNTETRITIPGTPDQTWTFGADGNLTIPGNITKDGQTITIDVETSGSYTATIIGVQSTTTDLLIGNMYQGVSIQADGAVVIGSKFNTSAPVVIFGATNLNEGEDGGDVLIQGGFSQVGQNGGVYIEGQYAEILTTDSLVIGNGDNGPWVFDNSDQGLIFPDNTTQYTAWQGSTIVSDTAPDNDLGRIWFNSTDGRAYVKYNDLWTDLSPQVIPSPDTYLEGLTIEDTTIAKTTFNDSKSISINNEGKIVVLKTTGELVVPGDVVPETTGTQKLGTATKRWKEAHIDEIHTVIDGGGASTWLTAD